MSSRKQHDQYEALKAFIDAAAADARVVTDHVPQQCDLCGEIAELRPYGPKGEHVCFKCGMQDEGAAKARFFGEPHATQEGE